MEKTRITIVAELGVSIGMILLMVSALIEGSVFKIIVTSVVFGGLCILFPSRIVNQEKEKGSNRTEKHVPIKVEEVLVSKENRIETKTRNNTKVKRRKKGNKKERIMTSGSVKEKVSSKESFQEAQAPDDIAAYLAKLRDRIGS